MREFKTRARHKDIRPPERMYCSGPIYSFVHRDKVRVTELWCVGKLLARSTMEPDGNGFPASEGFAFDILRDSILRQRPYID